MKNFELSFKDCFINVKNVEILNISAGTGKVDLYLKDNTKKIDK
ncbi:hypothetical protein ACFLY2_02600 [Patescibacteria group bacterium]